MSSEFDRLAASLQHLAIQVRDRFEADWKSGTRPQIRDYVDQTPGLDRQTLLSLLIPLEIHYRRLAGESPTQEEYCQAFPDDRSTIEQCFRGKSAEPDESPALETTFAQSVAEQAQSITEQVGSHIGRYKLMEKIGEGGMGLVFVAMQQQPVRRKVAIKLIKPGMDTNEVVARFEAERQALALMDHPNIAHVLDGGATESGRPYFVMELVEGVPVTEYCDKHNVSIRERLKIFATVCRAIQHAHQKGIIHRDIKPSNVLVTRQDGVPTVKVIDFGVAKAIDQPLTERTIYTRFGSMVGTPLYMSPEQALLGSLDIDTRSDIYSLGVLLYELLTGTTPFDKERMRKAAFDEICRMIREEEPPRPSTRVSTQGDKSSQFPTGPRSNPSKLGHMMRGELDWIVMKSLEKDRNRRYETANGFAADIERYLTHQPVEACPPSASYRLRKFARRNKTAIATTTAVGLSLVAGIIGTTWQAIEANNERDRALIARGEAIVEANRANVAQGIAKQRLVMVEAQKEVIETEKKKVEQEKRIAVQEREIASAVQDFLFQKLLGAADPRNQANLLQRIGDVTSDVKHDLTIRELLDRAAVEINEQNIENSYPNQTQVQIKILHIVGYTYYRIGEYQRAVDHLERSLERSLRIRDKNHIDVFNTGRILAGALQWNGDHEEAIQWFEKLLEDARKQFGQVAHETVDIMASLTDCYTEHDQMEKAQTLGEEARKTAILVYGPDGYGNYKSLDSLAGAYALMGRHDNAFELSKRAYELMHAEFGSDYPITLNLADQLVLRYTYCAQFDDAIELAERIRPQMIQTFGKEHRLTISNQRNLADSYWGGGRLRDALKHYQEVHQLYVDSIGPDHSRTLGILRRIAGVYTRLGDHETALPLNERLAEIYLQQDALAEIATQTVMHNLAENYFQLRRQEQDIEFCEEFYALNLRDLGPNHRFTIDAMEVLGYHLNRAGQHDRGLELFRQAHQWHDRNLGPDAPETSSLFRRLAAECIFAGKILQAEPIWKELSIQNPGHWTYAYFAAAHQGWLGREGDFVTTIERSIASFKDSDESTYRKYFLMAACMLPNNDPELLANLQTLAELTIEHTKGTDKLVYAMISRGMVEYRKGQYETSEQTFRRSLELASQQIYLRPISRFYLAMSLFHQNKIEESRKHAILGAAEVLPVPAQGSDLDFELYTMDLPLWNAYWEAKSLIEFEDPSNEEMAQLWIADLEAKLEMQPTNSIASYFLTTLLRYTTQQDKCKELLDQWYERSDKIKPDMNAHRMLMAHLLFPEGKTTPDLLEIAKQNADMHPKCRRMLGLAYYRQGNSSEALPHLLAAAKPALEEDEDLITLLSLSVVQLELRQLEAAGETIDRAFRIHEKFQGRRRERFHWRAWGAIPSLWREVKALMEETGFDAPVPKLPPVYQATLEIADDPN